MVIGAPVNELGKDRRVTESEIGVIDVQVRVFGSRHDLPENGVLFDAVDETEYRHVYPRPREREFIQIRLGVVGDIAIIDFLFVVCGGGRDLAAIADQSADAVGHEHVTGDAILADGAEKWIRRDGRELKGPRLGYPVRRDADGKAVLAEGDLDGDPDFRGLKSYCRLEARVRHPEVNGRVRGDKLLGDRVIRVVGIVGLDYERGSRLGEESLRQVLVFRVHGRRPAIAAFGIKLEGKRPPVKVDGPERGRDRFGAGRDIGDKFRRGVILRLGVLIGVDKTLDPGKRRKRRGFASSGSQDDDENARDGENRDYRKQYFPLTQNKSPL